MSQSRSRGRPVEVDRVELGRRALELFAERGFAEVTMDDIARAAGVSRRTLFRHFRSKNDLVWDGVGEFTALVERALVELDEAGLDSFALLHRAYVAAFSHVGLVDERTREALLLLADNPSVYAHGAEQMNRLQRVLAEYVAAREGLAAGDLRPSVLAASVVHTAFAAVVWWAKHDSGELVEVLDAALNQIDPSAG